MNPRNLVIAALLFALGFMATRSCDTARGAASPAGPPHKEATWHEQ